MSMGTITNPQIDENEELVKRLEEETASLKEEVARLHSDLSSEREKLEEVMSAYAAENEEAMNEFVSLKSEKEDLMAERDALLAKVGRLDSTSLLPIHAFYSGQVTVVAAINFLHLRSPRGPLRSRG